MRPIATIPLLLLCSYLMAGQEEKPKTYAPWVTCFDETGTHFIGPKSMKTPVLASPDQRNRAYAENEARHDSRFPESCENTATLYVSVSGAPFRPVYTQSKASPANMNAGSLGPATWSGNSRWLFIEQAVLSYGSDCWRVRLPAVRRSDSEDRRTGHIRRRPTRRREAVRCHVRRVPGIQQEEPVHREDELLAG
jgi:hypothetical protein